MKPASSARAEQRGSSLVETLIALSILAMALVSIFGAMSSFVVVNGRNQARSNAAAAARTQLEQLRFVDPATLPATGFQTSSATIGEHSFTVFTEYCVNTGYCDDGTRHVVIRVEENGRRVFETETVITQLR